MAKPARCRVAGLPVGHPRRGGNESPAAPTELDAVAAALWAAARPTVGLPLTLRCLAAHWRLEPPGGGASDAPPVEAAALVRLVGWRAGIRIPTDVVADDAARVKAVDKALQRRLQLSPTRRW